MRCQTEDNFANLLQKARFLLNTSRRAFAEKNNLSQSQISNWEGSITLPIDSSLDHLAIAYGVNLENLKRLHQAAKDERSRLVKGRKNTHGQKDLFEHYKSNVNPHTLNLIRYITARH